MINQPHIAIIGCGTMGHSIALNAAWKGLQVNLYGPDDTEIGKGLSGIRAKLGIMVSAGLLSADAMPSLLERIVPTTSLQAAAAPASFVIEAIPENLSMKHELYRKLESICARDTVFASNTSGLMPSAIAEALVHRDRFIVLHFWNPAHLVPLVEVVRASATSDATEQRSMALLHDMQKKPVLVRKEIAGFIGNRLQFALLREAQYLLEQGVASAEDIDAAVTGGIGRRLPVTGPLLSADMGGLDVFEAISNYLFSDLSQATAAAPSLAALVAGGKLGQKSGEGYYQWTAQRSDQLNQQREAELIRFLKQDGSGG